MKCINCGYENNSEAKFCNECGRDLNDCVQELVETEEVKINTDGVDSERAEIKTEEAQKEAKSKEANINAEATESVVTIENISVYSKPARKKNKAVIISAVVAGVILITGLSVGGFKYKQISDNKKAADFVIHLIDDIGEVSANETSANKIYDASQAYNSLSEEQKKYVTNEATLSKANQEYEINKATLNLSVLALYLKNNSELCQAFFSDYTSVWYNAIYRKTDEYNNGDFSDFNNALTAFASSNTYTSAQKTLNDTNNKILKTWKETINIPQNKQELYNAIKNLYTAYQPLYSLATKPQGSYISYKEETKRLSAAYKTAYASLAAVMPEIETISK